MIRMFSGKGCHILRLSFLAGCLAGLMSFSDAEAKPLVRNGVQRTYYATGEVRQEFRFKNGLLLRKKAFYKNGRYVLYHKYSNGRPYVKRYYYDTGRLQSVWTAKSRMTKVYYPDGKLKAVVHSDSQDVDKNIPASYVFEGP